MVFADLLFLYLFLPALLAAYYAVRANLRNWVLVVASLLFYAWGEPVWVLLLVGSAAVDYHCGRYIGARTEPGARRRGLVVSLVVNLSLLAVFKYAGFLVTNLNVFSGLGLPVPAIVMPIGISFYTFQKISYTVDVYRGRARVQESFPDFLLFVSLFPQLIAGPIVRYTEIAEELDQRTCRFSDVEAGLRRFITGLLKKVAIANAAGHLAAVWLDPGLETQTVAGAWLGAVMFTLQIYYDFSGYSDMAIGLGRMFGFHFPENFDHPYVSRSATEFWRRWHMTLGRFFRDYLYIPLGGNRRRVYLNLLVVWFLTGLWHGASWNFVVWGLYYLVFLVLEKAFLGAALRRIPAVFGHVYLLLVVIVGWVLFYFTDLSLALAHLKIMFFLEGVPAIDLPVKIAVANNLYWLLAALLFCLPVAALGRRLLVAFEAKAGAVPGLAVSLTAALAGLILSTMLLVGQTYNPFLYYRF
jgi:alginate O-acetyltransferase complex protein AlgI